MTHFTIWQWADFVRGLRDDPARSAMEMHLSSGCPRCQQTVDLLGGVAAIAPGEADYGAPEHAIRCAKAIYSLYRPETANFPRLPVQLVFDSARDLLPVGMRAHTPLSRHARYQVGSYSLDLQLEQEPASGPVSLIGQLADRRTTTTNYTDLPVWLLERNSLVASTFCNRYGEFQLKYDSARHVRLCLPLRAIRKRLEVPLYRLAPGRSSRPQTGKIRRRPVRRKPSGAG